MNDSPYEVSSLYCQSCGGQDMQVVDVKPILGEGINSPGRVSHYTLFVECHNAPIDRGKCLAIAQVVDVPPAKELPDDLNRVITHIVGGADPKYRVLEEYLGGLA